jgi:hypothetical protein
MHASYAAEITRRVENGTRRVVHIDTADLGTVIQLDLDVLIDIWV